MKSICKLILLVNRMINQVLFLSFIGLGSSITLYADISPKEAVVYPNQTVTFSCESNGGYTYWEVNGTNHNNLEVAMRRDMIKDPDEKTFTINNPYKYNTSNVTCVTRLTFESQQHFSSTTLLLVQGVLSAVAELSCTNSSSDIISVMWTAPFSLNVTESDPNIWYSVSIHNVTDGNNPTIVNCTDCFNIIDTQYTFITEYFNKSHQYNITVTSNNGAGRGEINSIICPNITNIGTSEQRNIGATSVSPDFEAYSNNFSNESHHNETGNKSKDHMVYIACGVVILPVILLLVLIGILIRFCHLKRKCKLLEMRTRKVVTLDDQSNDSMNGGYVRSDSPSGRSTSTPPQFPIRRRVRPQQH